MNSSNKPSNFSWMASLLAPSPNDLAFPTSICFIDGSNKRSVAAQGNRILIFDEAEQNAFERLGAECGTVAFAA